MCSSAWHACPPPANLTTAAAPAVPDTLSCLTRLTSLSLVNVALNSGGWVPTGLSLLAAACVGGRFNGSAPAMLRTGGGNTTAACRLLTRQPKDASTLLLKSPSPVLIHTAST